MLKNGTHVKIISKSIGCSIDVIKYKEGYIINKYDNGDIYKYSKKNYYVIWEFYTDRVFYGDHFLECDLINLDNYLPENLFEL